MAGLIPVVLFAGFVLYQLWSFQRDQLRERHQSAVASLAVIIAEQLRDGIQRLEVLALSPQLAQQDLNAFRALVNDGLLARNPDWSNILLIEVPTGRQLINLAAKPNVELSPSGDRQHQQQAIAARKPAVSDLFKGRTTGKMVTEIAVPVLRDDEVKYLLSATLDLNRLTAMLNRRVTATGVAVIVDRQLTIVGRTRGGSDYVGKTTVPALHEKMQRSSEGWDRFVAFEGDAVYTAWAAVPDFGWKVAYGIPAAPIESSLTRSLALLVGAGILFIALGSWLALRAAQRVSTAINSAARAAKEAADGRVAEFDAHNINELEQLSEALQSAARRLKTEAAERAVAEKERNRLFVKEREMRVLVQNESRAKDEFLAMLGHELRNPVAAIMNAAEVLKRTPEAAACHDAAEIIARQAAHQGRLLDDLLDVGRVTSGKVELKLERVDLAAQVQAALAALEASDRTSRHVITRSLSSVWVAGDPTRLEQVIVNLVSNALKFTPSDGRITVSTARVGSNAVLRVTDSGIGIDPHTLPRVFDLFVQQEQSRTTSSGLGIGLTLVKRLVEMHGGSVTATSKGRDEGAEFIVRIPACDAPAVASASAARPEKLKPLRVLLVEDNADVRDMLGAVLTLENHHVTAVETGRAAISAAVEARPQVAIIDIGLPDIAGEEVARRIRELAGNGVRLVALSGFGKRPGSDGFFDAQLTKPVRPDELLKAIASVKSSGEPVK